MEDFAFVPILCAVLFALHALILFAFFTHRQRVRIASGHQRNCPRWRRETTIISYALCITNIILIIAGAVYFRKLDRWMWKICPTMTSLSDCTSISETWTKVSVWTVIPAVFAVGMMITSFSRARSTFFENPELLYSPKFHVWGYCLFHIAFLLHMPLGFPQAFFKPKAGHYWSYVSMTMAMLTICAYMAGVVCWFEGAIRMRYMPTTQRPTPQAARPGDGIELTIFTTAGGQDTGRSSV